MLNRKRVWGVVLLFVLLLPAAGWVVAQTVRFLRFTDGSVPRGITMAEVESKKGKPAEVVGPVGDPPISKWLFDDGEVVVFERDLVLDSFIRNQ
jgi:hypothetical protein